jgi:hypothetical protein
MIASNVRSDLQTGRDASDRIISGLGKLYCLKLSNKVFSENMNRQDQMILKI